MTSPPYVAVSSGSSYYDNVRPLAYPDSDAVLICFDISRPETLDSVIKKVRLLSDGLGLKRQGPDARQLAFSRLGGSRLSGSLLRLNRIFEDA